jgi:hypothetical protein
LCSKKRRARAFYTKTKYKKINLFDKEEHRFKKLGKYINDKKYFNYQSLLGSGKKQRFGGGLNLIFKPLHLIAPIKAVNIGSKFVLLLHYFSINLVKRDFDF